MKGGKLFLHISWQILASAIGSQAMGTVHVFVIRNIPPPKKNPIPQKRYLMKWSLYPLLNFVQISLPVVWRKASKGSLAITL